jgi:tRNA threonylcarbamoyladenosine biosynthesis protein TsaB
MPPCLLAFDTSTERLAVGLSTATGVWTAIEPGGARSSQRLIPSIHELLQRASTSLADLDAIAFGCGPGAFTGLRTACAVAQGLAFGAGKPVLAIASLLIVAEDARWADLAGDRTDITDDADEADNKAWWVAVDARMDEVYAAQYAFQAGDWRVVRAPALYTLAALAQRWQGEPPQRIAGNASSVFADRLPMARSHCVAAETDRAGALLRLAAQAWRDGAATSPDDALPVYLRDKVALTTAERDARRDAATAAVAAS